MPLRYPRRCVLVLALTALAGCATAMRGTTQDLALNSVPDGAIVKASNGMSCTTPCTLAVPRKDPLTFTFSKPGCTSASAQVTPRISGTGIAFGGVMDYSSGSVYNLQPNPLTTTLRCGR